MNAAATPTDTVSPEQTEIEQQVVRALKTVYDPEIPVDIWELGLVYGVNVNLTARSAHIYMTLTAPACPVASMRSPGSPPVRRASKPACWRPAPPQRCSPSIPRRPSIRISADSRR